MPSVRDIVDTASKKDYQFSSIVLSIINSLPFQQRRSGS
jgi:hypothetical protein